jgi:hypothetical protein
MQSGSALSSSCTLRSLVRTNPVLYLTVSDGIVQAIAYVLSKRHVEGAGSMDDEPGPDEAAIASSPMKKSKSSVPRFCDK